MIATLLVLWLSSIAGTSGPADPVRPAPHVTGRVVDTSGEPLAGARITDGTRVLTRSAGDGRFSFPLPDPAPHALAIESPAHARRDIALPHDAPDLGEVVLLRTGSVVANVAGVRGVREITLVRHGDRNARPITRAKPKGTVTFERLDPGNYLLTVRGDAPLQQKSRLVEVGEGATARVTMTVDRMPLRGYVYVGREPLAGADLQISGPTNAWQAKLRTDADGFFESELWQVGPMKAVVRSPQLPTLFATGIRPDDALERDAVEWNIIIPDRSVAGRIVDDGGAAVAGATVSAEAEDGEFRTRFKAITDASGAFRFGAARSGRYELEVDSKRHGKPQPVRFELQDGDPDKHLELVLQRAIDVRVRVTRADGTPVAGAIVADGVTEDGAKALMRVRTSPTGEAMLRGREGEEKTLYVVPRHGSFAIVRATVDAQSLEHGIDVVVPDGRSALVIHARDEKGAALDGIGFVVRYNGEVLPPALLQLIAQQQQIDYRITRAGDARIHGLPDGKYELWAYRLPREAERLIENPGGYEPSLELALTGGTYEATLTFGR